MREYPKGKYLQDVKIIKTERKLLIEVEPEVLMKDTDSSSVEEALEKIQELKRRVDKRYNREHTPYNFEKEVFTVYYLKIISQVRMDNWLLKDSRCII